jgi:hypothetical protein
MMRRVALVLLPARDDMDVEHIARFTRPSAS